MQDNKKKKKVMIFGTFDGLHPGHKFFIRESARIGIELIVVLSSDNYIQSMKKTKPINLYARRKALLDECSEVNYVIPADKELGSFHVLEREKPTVICLGHDQTALKDSLELWLNSHLSFVKPEIVVIAPYKRDLYSSTQLRNN